MDKNAALRELSFASIASAVGIDFSKFKRRKGKNGPEVYGPCPICKPKHNQTAFSYSDSGLWNCFAGGHHGRGAIDFIKELRGCGFQDAINFLEVIRPIPNGNGSPSANSGATEANLKPFDVGKYHKFKVPCSWLEQRIPDTAIRDRYGVFCYNNPARRSAYSSRVMIPVKDLEGGLHGYLGRSILSEPHPDVPKYLFPKNLPKSQFLFGAHELSRPDTSHNGHLPLKIVYLVESPFAVMKFAMYGLPAVSPFGWSISSEQVQLLRQISKGLIYIPDTNKRTEAQQYVALLAEHVWVRYPPLPDGIDDPEHLSKEQILALSR